MKSATHEINHPDSLSDIQMFIPCWPHRRSASKMRKPVRGRREKWCVEELFPFSPSVLLMVVSCMLQVCVCLACGDEWVKLWQSHDTPLMSHSNHAKSALLLCTATQWRVTDGLRLSRSSHPWPIIHRDSYKTEHILWIIAQELMWLCLSFHKISFIAWSRLKDAFFSRKLAKEEEVGEREGKMGGG